jgi:hypothetical protein
MFITVLLQPLLHQAPGAVAKRVSAEHSAKAAFSNSSHVLFSETAINQQLRFYERVK